MKPALQTILTALAVVVFFAVVIAGIYCMAEDESKVNVQRRRREAEDELIRRDQLRQAQERAAGVKSCPCAR